MLVTRLLNGKVSITVQSIRRLSKSKKSPVIRLPLCIMKDFIVMPTMSVDITDKATFKWFRGISPKARSKLISEGVDSNLIEQDKGMFWLYLSEDITYIPSSNDVAHHLKVVCNIPEAIFDNRVLLSDITKSPVELGPESFPFEERHKFTSHVLSNYDEFRIVSYNILADMYGDSNYSREHLFGHCPPHALDMNYRQHVLLKEILGYNGDVVCLQEVDWKYFTSIFEPWLKTVGGYRGTFAPKGLNLHEGPATFFRASKFDSIDSHRVLLSDLIGPVAPEARLYDERGSTIDKKQKPFEKKMPTPEPCPILLDPNSELTKMCLAKFEPIRLALTSSERSRDRFMQRNTVMQITLLRCKDSPNDHLLIGNTHLYFAPDADHIRLLQGMVCIKYLEFLKDHYISKISHERGIHDIKVRVVFCGDFNSPPEDGLHSFIEGKETRGLEDWNCNDEEYIRGFELGTTIQLSSAYSDIRYTNYTAEFKDCLDYIYFDRQQLVCDSVVPLPDDEVLSEIGGIPSEVFPSDHLALVANLRFASVD